MAYTCGRGMHNNVSIGFVKSNQPRMMRPVRNDSSGNSNGDVITKKIPQSLQCCKSGRLKLLLRNPARNEMGSKKKQQMGNLLKKRKVLQIFIRITMLS